MAASSPSIALADSYRLIFSRAAALLSESRGFRETLEQTLAATLPELGDFGFFDARQDDGTVLRVSRAYEDERTELLLRPTRWAPQLRTDLNLCALSTGQPALHPDIDDGWYQTVAANEGHLELLRQLAFRSMITVPMRHRGELIGALTLFMGRSGRRHTAEHFSIARDLAGLASPVVANARLVERHAAAERALRVSEERLRVSLRAAGIGWWDWKIDSNEVFWSDEYRDIYGLDPDEKPDFRRGMRAVMPEDVPAIEASIREALEEGKEFGTEHRVQHPQRGLRYVQATGRAVLGEDGRPTRMTGIVMDVTERRRNARELEYLREQLAEELDAMRMLHSISNRHIRREEKLEDLLQEVLEAALEITGRDRGAIQLVDPETDALRIVAHKGFTPGFFEAFELIRKDHGMASAVAWRDGKRCVVHDVASDPLFDEARRARMLAAGIRGLQSTPLRARDGRVIGIFTTHATRPRAWEERELRLVDLLAREASAFIERAQSEALLKEADRRKDEFLAILAHELRNPLAPIRYAVSIVREPATTESQRRRAESVIERQVEHMGRLLDDLLDVSRIARGTVQLRRQHVSLQAICSAALEAARPLLEAKQHALATRLPEATTMVDVDPVRLTQILTNLLNNACKYTDPGGRIELEVVRDAAELRLRVRDSGIGISPEMRSRLFTLFAQADGALQRAEGGLGIGLALVRGFVELHGGTIEARSDGPGKGSEFLVRLPGVVLEAEASAPMPANASPRTRRLRVLVADDNPDICETCSMLVRLWGHEPLVASTGHEALEVIRRERPDVAVLDIGMPRMSGYDVAKQVRAEGLPVSLIAVTGWGQEEAKQSAAAAGFDHHLTKPVDAGMLEHILAQVAPR